MNFFFKTNNNQLTRTFNYKQYYYPLITHQTNQPIFTLNKKTTFPKAFLVPLLVGSYIYNIAPLTSALMANIFTTSLSFLIGKYQLLKHFAKVQELYITNQKQYKFVLNKKAYLFGLQNMYIVKWQNVILWQKQQKYLVAFCKLDNKILRLRIGQSKIKQGQIMHALRNGYHVVL